MQCSSVIRSRGMRESVGEPFNLCIVEDIEDCGMVSVLKWLWGHHAQPTAN